MSRPKRQRSDDDDVIIKILVPASGTGFIIGRGGETIKKIQREMKATLDLSRENFPGGTDKPGMITGEKENAKKMLEFIVETINEKLRGPGADTSQYEAKLIVPDTTAGRIIGKGGQNVKKVISESGSQVRIWAIEEKIPFNERMVTVRGEKAKMMKGLGLVYESIVNDPESKSFPSVDYGSGGGGGSMDFDRGMEQGRDMGFQSQMDRPRPNISNNPGVEGVKALLRNKGFNYSESEEISMAMGTLVDFGFFSKNSPPPVTMESMALLLLAGKGIGLSDQFPRQQSSYDSGNNRGMDMGGGGGYDQRNMGGDGFRERDYDTRANMGGGNFGGQSGRNGRYDDNVNMGGGNNYGNRDMGGQYDDGARGGGNFDQFGDNYQSPRGGYGMGSDRDRDRGVSNVTLEMDIEDSIINMVAGNRASKLYDVMDATGCKINVSDAGVFAPGTRNRIITIRGSVNGTQRAYNLLQQQCNQARQMYR